MIVLWGPSLVQIYNDGYAEIAGAKHPMALGQATQECWPEVWGFNGPIYDVVLRGAARRFEGQKLTILRQGAPEEAWFDLTYSPVRDEAGTVASILVVVIETTARVCLTAQLEAKKEVLKHANLVLAAEGRTLRTLFKQAPGFMCVLRGPDHVFELANAAYSQLIGHRDVIGMPVAAALPELKAEGQGFLGLLDSVYATGQTFTGRQMPFKVQREPGGTLEVCYVDLVYQPITNAAGQAVGFDRRCPLEQRVPSRGPRTGPIRVAPLADNGRAVPYQVPAPPCCAWPLALRGGRSGACRARSPHVFLHGRCSKMLLSRMAGRSASCSHATAVV